MERFKRQMVTQTKTKKQNETVSVPKENILNVLNESTWLQRWEAYKAFKF